MIIDNIKKYLTIIYRLPSSIVLFIYLFIKYIKKIDFENPRIDKHSSEANIDMEDFRPIGRHIDLAFWILITYITFF